MVLRTVTSKAYNTYSDYLPEGTNFIPIFENIHFENFFFQTSE